MPRRANDPDLLRAQAQGGREGENAWRVARSQLAGQRQDAVRSAMQAAALRGAPAAAIAQMRNQVAAPYNQAIRGVTQSGASFAQDMAARDNRMDDYTQTILAARQLIPVQVQQALAPIQAQNRFNLQQIRMQGDARVAEIQAQTALELAQMRADARRARQSAAADKPSLTESELRNALTAAAQEKVGGAVEEIGGQVQKGREQESLNLIQNVIARGMQQYPAAAARDASRQQFAANLEGARWMAKAIAEQQGQDVTGYITKPDYASPADIERYHQLYADLGQEDQPGTDYSATGPMFSGQLAEGSQFGEAIAALNDEQRVPGSMLTTPGGMQASFRLGPFADQTQQQPVDQSYPTASADQAALLAQLGKAGAAGDILRAVEDRYGGVLSLPGPGTIEAEPLSQYGALSEQQVADLSPYARQLVQGAPAPFTNVDAVEQMLLGAPGNADLVTGQAEISPYAADVKQQAMLLAGRPLSRQYDIGGMPGVLNAIAQTPETLYDINQEALGQPTTAEQIAAAQADAAQTEEDKKAEAQGYEDAAKQQFYARFNAPMPSSAGTHQQVYALTLDPNSPTASAFQLVFDRLQEVITGGDYRDEDDAIQQAFAAAGVDPNLPFMNLLKQIAQL